MPLLLSKPLLLCAVVVTGDSRLITAVMAADLKAFSKHAKRQTVSCDDVKLLARKLPELTADLDQFEEANSSSSRSERQGQSPPSRGGGGGGGSSAPAPSTFICSMLPHALF